jgi:multiple sugar transport system permease protein
MTVAALPTRAAARSQADVLHAARVARRRRWLTYLGVAVLSAVLIVWSLLPIYNMIMVSLDAHSDVLSTHIFPPHASLGAYWTVITESFWYLQFFWEQFGRSVFFATMVVLIVLTIGSFAAYSVGRLRIKYGWLVTNAALLTYVIPASFLAIPYYRLMAQYGMMNNLWAVIASVVAFATPYAIFILQQYGRSIPIELDEAARIDGASPVQIYFRVYLPLMTPALVAVGTFAMLASWNEFLYQFLLLSSEKSMTVPIAIVQFINSDESPWNYMMATAAIYALPPVIVYYAFRRYMAAGLTTGGVKG